MFENTGASALTANVDLTLAWILHWEQTGVQPCCASRVVMDHEKLLTPALMHTKGWEGKTNPPSAHSCMSVCPHSRK